MNNMFKDKEMTKNVVNLVRRPVLGFVHTGAVLKGQVDIMSGLLRLLLGVSFSGTSGRQRAVVLLSRFVDQLLSLLCLVLNIQVPSSRGK